MVLGPCRRESENDFPRVSSGLLQDDIRACEVLFDNDIKLEAKQREEILTDDDDDLPRAGWFVDTQTDFARPCSLYWFRHRLHKREGQRGANAGGGQMKEMAGESPLSLSLFEQWGIAILTKLPDGSTSF